MLHSTKVEIIWTIIPVIILVVMGVPAAELILKQEDTPFPIAIRVTGYQWKWEYSTWMPPRAWISFPRWRAIRILRVNRTPASIPIRFQLSVGSRPPLVIPAAPRCGAADLAGVIMLGGCRTSAQNARRFPASS